MNATAVKGEGISTGTIHDRILQSYTLIPDMDDVKQVFEEWLSHKLVDTRSFVTAPEMWKLWSRVYEMQASAVELAFLYSLLIAAGASSLTHTTRLDKRIIDSLYSNVAAKAFVGEALTLLSLCFLDNDGGSGESGSSKVDYDWRDISRCPAFLLHCRIHSILCCFFHQARLVSFSSKHGNQAINLARRYGLFHQLQSADNVVHEMRNTSTIQMHLYALRRIQFDLTVYPRLSMSPDGEEKCILQREEVFTDVELLAQNPITGITLEPLALDFQRLKLVLSEVRALTCHQVMQERAIESMMQQQRDAHSSRKRFRSSSTSSKHTDSSQSLDAPTISDNLLALDSSSRLLANDDATLAIMAKLPSWTKVDAQSNWFANGDPNVFDGTSAINILWVRFSCNRMRVETLLQPRNVVDVSSQIQTRVMGAAQDTLFLLAKTLQLLKTPFRFASAHQWLFDEAEWAVGVFNSIIETEITREMIISQDSDTTLHAQSQISREASITTSSTSPLPSHYHSPVSATSPSPSTIARTSLSSDGRTDDAPRLEPLITVNDHLKRQVISKPSSFRHQKMDTYVAKDTSYRLFAWFIFGFKGIQSVLRDLHCISPAVMKTSEILLRMQVPRPIKYEDSDSPSSLSSSSSSSTSLSSKPKSQDKLEREALIRIKRPSLEY